MTPYINGLNYQRVSIRADALDQLMMLFLSSQNETERRSAWQALHQGTRISSAPGFSEEMHTVIIRDSRRIVDFVRTRIGFIGYELLQHIEHELLWMRKHNRRDGPSGRESKSIERARAALDKAILAFRDKANQDSSFVIYKTLVGYDSVFEPAWTDDDFDIKVEADYRELKIAELVASVDDENKDSWYNLLLTCAQTESSDLATFPSFGNFLQKLGKAKPKILLSYIKLENPSLIRFLMSMLLGLEGTECQPDVEELINTWVTEGKHLPEISWSQRALTSADSSIADRVLDEAIAVGDQISVLNMIEAANRRKMSWPDGEAATFVVRAINYLAKHGNTAWASGYLGARASDSVFASLHFDQARDVLTALVAHPRIDWREEEILAAIHIVLDETGVLTGEFGHVEAYRLKKIEIEKWLKHPSAKVAAFAQSHILTLEKQISAEQRRAEEDVEMRKREWGSSDDTEE